MLEMKNKLQVAKQVHRILKPNGNLYIIDYSTSNKYLKELVDVDNVYLEDYNKIFNRIFNPIHTFEHDQLSYTHYVKNHKILVV
jgi:ubiquinone/menaquinone biosynthesis C-methylase UbiE